MLFTGRQAKPIGLLFERGVLRAFRSSLISSREYAGSKEARYGKEQQPTKCC